jgi:uncharacterized BrkB/YihY/UPF0761 family membrane protein
MKFLKKFLFNLTLYVIGFTILYFIAPELWRAGFQIFSAFIGTGLTIFFFSTLTILAALPRRRL